MKELLIHEDGTSLNAFQPVDGGFRFIGSQDDAKRWIQHNVAIIAELEKKHSIRVILCRLFTKGVIDFETIEELYIAYMKVRESLNEEEGSNNRMRT